MTTQPLQVRLTGGYLDWSEHCWPVHGPMTLEQLCRVMARQANRAHDYASSWGIKDTARGPYEAWQWCRKQWSTGNAGEPSWLVRQYLDQAQELVALED